MVQCSTCMIQCSAGMIQCSRGDRGELTHFSLKTIFCQNGTSLLNYVGMVVFHAI